MSILIEGMEMPTSCVDCRFHKSIYCTLTDICTNTAQGCPLVPIPPHGRLIDAGAIPYNKIMLEDDNYYYGVTKPYIDRMPTIIPASGGNEDE